MEEARLARIEAQQERILAMLQGLSEKVEDRIDATDEWRARMEKLLHGGNGTGPGLLVKLDRLEQSHERARWLMRAVVGAVVTLTVGAFWAIITV